MCNYFFKIIAKDLQTLDKLPGRQSRGTQMIYSVILKRERSICIIAEFSKLKL